MESKAPKIYQVTQELLISKIMIKTTLRKVGNKLNVISELHVIEQLGRSEKRILIVNMSCNVWPASWSVLTLLITVHLFVDPDENNLSRVFQRYVCVKGTFMER